MHINFNAGQGRPKGLLAQVLTAIVGVVALIGAAMFSVVILVVAAIGGLLLSLYFWWKTRAVRAHVEDLRRAQSRAPGQGGEASGGDFIEGEAVRVSEAEHLLEETRNARS